MDVAETNNSEIDVRGLVAVLWHRAWLIGLITGLAFVGAYGSEARKPDLYKATAQVQVSDPMQTMLSGAARSRADIESEVATQVERLKAPNVVETANATLGEETAAQVEGVWVDPVEGTSLIDINASSESPEVAMAAANAYADSYLEVRRSEITSVFTERATELRNKAEDLDERVAAIDLDLLDGDLEPQDRRALELDRSSYALQSSRYLEDASDYDLDAESRSMAVQLTQSATLPTAPYSPTPLRFAIPVAMAALLLSIGLVLLLERIDDRIATTEQAEAAAGGTAVLGLIPVYSDKRRGVRKIPRGAKRIIVPPDSSAAEAYRTLRTSIRFSSAGSAKTTLAVTSSSSGEGKSTVTANLAVALAEGGFRVVLVSADLRRPTVSTMFGVAETDMGLTSVLLGDAKLIDCLTNVELASGKRLYVLPSGPLPHNPAELLGSPAFGRAIRQIEEAGADFVLIDSPPVLPVSDPLTIAQQVDGVLVVAVVGRTRRKTLSQTVDRLRQVEGEVMGIVLNGLPTSGGRFGYYGTYGYAAAKPDVRASLGATSNEAEFPSQAQRSPETTRGAVNGAASGAAEDVTSDTAAVTERGAREAVGGVDW